MGTEGLDQGPRGLTSYMPVAITESFAALMARLSGEKPGVEQQHSAVLNERYDLSDRPAQGVTMDRTKPIQEGVRVKLPAGVTWESLAAMSPDQIRDQNLYPKGFYPLPHPKHQEGGFVIPHLEIDAIKQQDGRDLKRFDIDFDLPDHFLPEFTSCDVSDPAHRSGRCLAGQAGLADQLLSDVQWHSDSETIGRIAVAFDPLPGTTVQRHRRSPRGAAQPGGGLL
jgi:cytochrome c peroxidase